MRTGATTYSLLVLAFIGFGRLVGEAGTAPLFFQAPAPVDEPYIQVTRVTVEPSTIHKTDQPRRATVVVQVMLRGQAPTRRPTCKSGHTLLPHLVSMWNTRTQPELFLSRKI